MTGRNEVFQQAMNRGHSAAWDQDWERAASCYREALTENPEDSQALANLGLALFELGQFADSLQAYDRAAEISPDDPALFDRVSQLSEHCGDPESFAAASIRAAELYLQRQEAEKAIENLSRVVKADPENLEAHSRLAVIYDKLGKRQQAVAEYMAVASLFQRNQDLVRAFQAIDRALLVSPDSRELQQAQVMLRESQLLPMPNRSRAATGPLHSSPFRKDDEVLIDAAVPFPDPVSEGRDRAFAALAGLIFEESNGEGMPEPKKGAGRRNQKIVTGWLAGQKNNQAQILPHLSHAVELQSLSRPAEAGEALEHALGAGFENTALFFSLGYLFNEANQLDKAEHYLKFAAGSEGYVFAARLLLGQIHLQMGRVEEAALDCLEALKLADAGVVPSDKSETIKRQYGRVIEAEGERTDPQAKIQLCESITNLLMRGDWREHLALARRELPEGVDGGSPAPLGEMLVEARSSQVIESISAIKRLARAGHLRSAMEEALFALIHAPTYLPLHILLGEILLQGDHIPEATEKFRIVAHTYSSRGETDRAIELLRRVIRIAPMHTEARSRLIELLLSRGDIDQAVLEHVGVADVYYAMADLDRARETYHQALNLMGQTALTPEIRTQILHQVADIELQRLDWRKALQIYEQIRELDSGDQRAWMNLIQLKLRLGQESEAMVELKDYLSYLDQQGQGGQAVPFLEELVREIPEHQSFQRILDDLIQQAGTVPGIGIG